ncbi:diiron oxygenase [Streptomyces sp. NPDC057445]|uniref:diiron oxygenase n=1 Tax=Streptomyces sp. NPDC057445 TaxID=3346136 RepID=UPI00369C0166
MTEPATRAADRTSTNPKERITMDDSGFSTMLARLSEKSRDEYYNPYTKFTWPDTVPEDQWWMNPDYLTVSGTGLIDDEKTLKALARYETVNFFSLHVHGIRELMIEVAKRIHTPDFAEYNEYLHHFIGEENAHMWFFAEFCHRYTGGIYPEAASPLRREGFGNLWDDVIVFSRILIFEEIFDYYNSRMGKDQLIPDILREIHAAHHHDESRHVAFGKQLVKRLYDRALAADPDRREEIEKYVKDYMTYSVRSLYNPQIFRDCGVGNPLAVRREALSHPVREAFHVKLMTRVDRFFVAAGIFSTSWGTEHVSA